MLSAFKTCPGLCFSAYTAPASPPQPWPGAGRSWCLCLFFFLWGSHGHSSHFGGDKEEIIVACLLELNPVPVPFSEEYFMVPNNTGVQVRDFSKKYLISLKIHRFLNLLYPISSYKTYHHPRLTLLLHLFQSARNVLTTAQNCNLLTDNSNTANYRGRRKGVWSLSRKDVEGT